MAERILVVDDEKNYLWMLDELLREEGYDVITCQKVSEAVDVLREAGVDLLLAGHAHHASTHDASELVTRSGGALVIQAGTATSTRVREQEQSFTTIDIADGLVTVTVNAWTGDAFKAADAQPYKYQDGRWRILKAEEAAH